MTPPALNDAWQQLEIGSVAYEQFTKSVLTHIEYNNFICFLIEKYDKAKNIFRIRRGTKRLTLAILEVEEIKK